MSPTTQHDKRRNDSQTVQAAEPVPSDESFYTFKSNDAEQLALHICGDILGWCQQKKALAPVRECIIERASIDLVLKALTRTTEVRENFEIKPYSDCTGAAHATAYSPCASSYEYFLVGRSACTWMRRAQGAEARD
jgi:hypothetical protein